MSHSSSDSSPHPSLAELRSSQNTRIELIEKTRASMEGNKSCPSSTIGRVDKASRSSSKDSRDIRQSRKLRSLKRLRKDNASLNLQLQKALQSQTALEAKLSQLSKEKNMLECENKNLAMQLASNFHQEGKKSMKGTFDENSNFPQRSLPSMSRESNPFHRESGNDSMVSGWNNLFGKKSRWSSRLHQKYAESSTPSKTSLLSGSGELTDNDEANNISHRDEMDSITSYVKRKGEDVGRLEGELYKYRLTTNKLQLKISHLSQEHQMTLSDFGNIVDSYRELEEERDNYECILKLILKEKSSSESNLHELLDDLIKHLSSAAQNMGSEFSDHCSELGPDYSTTSSQYNRFSSKDFLQSVLQSIQGQNISIREEMTRLSETLHETTGQNMLLQSNNETLVEKVQELKKQLELLEVKEQEEKDKNNESSEKYNELDKIHQEVLTAKTELETTLKGKERELQRLVDKSKKDVGGQNEKIIKLQNENEKIEKEAATLRNDIEEQKQTIFNLRACLKDESGIWCERLKTTTREISSAKDQCKWLQSQIDKLNDQLKDAHGRIKLHEQDKAILAQKVLSAEEERKTLDRKILEIKGIMHGDTLYREALAQRNEALQLKINHLRKKSLSCNCTEIDTSDFEADSQMKKPNGDGKENETRHDLCGDWGSS